MNNCKILLIDTPADITLLNESIAHLLMPVSIQCVTSVKDAMTLVNLDIPDMILIGSGKLLENFEILSKARIIPIVVLQESDGFDILLKSSLSNVLFLTKPLDVEEIPEMIMKALKFLRMRKENA